MSECEKVAAILSPDYFSSEVCKEELMMARLRNRRSGGQVLLPVFWRSIDRELDLWLQIINYNDCREANEDKLRAARNR